VQNEELYLANSKFESYDELQVYTSIPNEQWSGWKQLT